ncbi:MAG: hypothetical protein AAF704_05195 [Cyanobacteria bacterium P01_D01_bin.123]
MSVLGGDDLLININGEPVEVDLAGIFPPTHAYGQLAAQRLEALLPAGAPVSIQPAEEVKGLLYAHIFDDRGLSINAQLIREGVSLVHRAPSAEPLQSLYKKAHADALRLEKGYFGQTQTSKTSEQARPLNLDATSAAIPLWTVRVSGGLLAAMAVFATANFVFRHWQRDRQRHAEMKTSRQQSNDKLAVRKSDMDEVLSRLDRLEHQLLNLEERMKRSK